MGWYITEESRRAMNLCSLSASRCSLFVSVFTRAAVDEVNEISPNWLHLDGNSFPVVQGLERN